MWTLTDGNLSAALPQLLIYFVTFVTLILLHIIISIRVKCKENFYSKYIRNIIVKYKVSFSEFEKLKVLLHLYNFLLCF